MKEEIFGPLLPVISFDNLDDVISKVKKKEKPLALYIYSKHKKISMRQALRRTPLLQADPVAMSHHRAQELKTPAIGGDVKHEYINIYNARIQR